VAVPFVDNEPQVNTMTWALAVVVGVVVGLLTGGVAERLPVPPLVQSMGVTAGLAASLSVARVLTVLTRLG
jgi:drug/metabolite transporter (DMT)-like permease